MKLNETKRKMLILIAQQPRTITYFTNGRYSGVSLSEESVSTRLSELVEAGFLYAADNCWHITALGRKKLDQKDTATPRAIVFKNGTYRTGMCDPFHTIQRPGSDHSHLKSRGNLC